MNSTIVRYQPGPRLRLNVPRIILIAGNVAVWGFVGWLWGR